MVVPENCFNLVLEHAWKVLIIDIIYSSGTNVCRRVNFDVTVSLRHIQEIFCRIKIRLIPPWGELLRIASKLKLTQKYLMRILEISYETFSVTFIAYQMNFVVSSTFQECCNGIYFPTYHFCQVRTMGYRQREKYPIFNHISKIKQKVSTQRWKWIQKTFWQQSLHAVHQKFHIWRNELKKIWIFWFNTWIANFKSSYVYRRKEKV